MRRRLPAIVLLLVLALPPLAQAATKQPVFGLRAGGNPKVGYFVYRTTPGATRSVSFGDKVPKAGADGAEERYARIEGREAVLRVAENTYGEFVAFLKKLR